MCIRDSHKEAAGGGASQVNTAVTTASSDIYIKLEVSENKATYHVASTADFSDEKVKTQTKTQKILMMKTKIHHHQSHLNHHQNQQLHQNQHLSQTQVQNRAVQILHQAVNQTVQMMTKTMMMN